MSDRAIELTVYEIQMDDALDRIVRSSDPSLQKLVEERIRNLLAGRGNRFSYALSKADFIRFARVYGEQYVNDPCADLDQYFDIANGRLFSRSVPTQLAILYLFGSGKHYRPNVGSLSAAGEGIAGFCMEQFGYRPLVRPLGIMPDAVLWTSRGGALHLALAEAKASTREHPNRLIEKNVAQFLIDIKTRAQGFSYHYEGYLIAVLFCDGGKVLCSCLRVDLSRYARAPKQTGPPSGIGTAIDPIDRPEDRLRSIIRLQAETGNMQDEYLTSVLSEEATRAATLARIRQQPSSLGKAPSLSQSDIDAFIHEVASSLGLADQWTAGQQLIRDVKGAERDRVTKALIRYLRPALELD
jgi:hypothetical protein